MDSIFNQPGADKEALQKSIDFTVDLTNMFFDEQQLLAHQIKDDPGDDKPKPKTATRARQERQKCVFFEIPTDKFFDCVE